MSILFSVSRTASSENWQANPSKSTASSVSITALDTLRTASPGRPPKYMARQISLHTNCEAARLSHTGEGHKRQPDLSILYQILFGMGFVNIHRQNLNPSGQHFVHNLEGGLSIFLLFAGFLALHGDFAHLALNGIPALHDHCAVKILAANRKIRGIILHRPVGADSTIPAAGRRSYTPPRELWGTCI